MAKRRTSLLFFGLAGLILGILYLVFFAESRGIPFVSKKEQWTIGIMRGNTPFSFTSPLNLINPLFKAEAVSDIPAKFVADPFLIKEGSTWFLFFEAYNNDTKQGDIALATSKNTLQWNYQQVVLDEPFHLSYPYVFKWKDEVYLIPETYETKSIRLYKADQFPTEWSLVDTLVTGKDFVDNSIVYYHDRWWLFTATTANDTLYLYSAVNLTGPWTEHPQSPIVAGNNHIARPSGRLLIYQDELYRYTMDVNPPNGTHQIQALKITDLTPTRYAEELLDSRPILQAEGKGWRRYGMHQIDPWQVGEEAWIAAVDGYGKYYFFDKDR